MILCTDQTNHTLYSDPIFLETKRVGQLLSFFLVVVSLSSWFAQAHKIALCCATTEWTNNVGHVAKSGQASSLCPIAPGYVRLTTSDTHHKNKTKILNSHQTVFRMEPAALETISHMKSYDLPHDLMPHWSCDPHMRLCANHVTLTWDHVLIMWPSHEIMCWLCADYVSNIRTVILISVCKGMNSSMAFSAS